MTTYKNKYILKFGGTKKLLMPGKIDIEGNAVPP